MEKLKDVYYSKKFFRTLGKELSTVYPAFDTRSFYRQAIKELDDLELKERITRTAVTLAKFLPSDFVNATKILDRLNKIIKPDFSYIFMPEFVARYGMDHFDMSLAALRRYTPNSSSEFGLREFLQADFERTMAEIAEWLDDPHDHVRRLVSETTRPKLPWATHLHPVIFDPSTTFHILEQLKDDPSLYVRKSVANHINDISKDHPDWVVAQLKRWDMSRPNIAWVVNRGLRTLVKKGRKDALTLLGYGGRPGSLAVTASISVDKIRIGDELKISLSIQTKSKQTQKLMIDYAVHYVKKSGQRRAKIFKWTSRSLRPGDVVEISRCHRFADLNTRKHFPGEHAIEIIINGEGQGILEFDVTA